MLGRAFSVMTALLLLMSVFFIIPSIVHRNNITDLASETSDSIVLRFDFPAPVVAGDVDGSSVAMSTLPQSGAPGEPILPFRLVKVLIPQGKDVKQVEVTPSGRRELEGTFKVRYGKTPMPTSSSTGVEGKPEGAIYNSTSPFPGSLFSDISVQWLRGYKIVLLKIYPVQYIPRTGELYYFESMNVTLTLRGTSETSSFFRNLSRDAALVSGIVDNSEAMETYTGEAWRGQQAAQALGSPQYEYVLITNKTLQSAFQPLIDWKRQKGLNATMVFVEDIMKNPNYNSNGLFGDGSGSPKFNDTQAHIRNFIKDAYLNWGTEYVLLSGDDDVIPARGVYDFAGYNGNYTDYNIPCDMYYGALDGSWDKDNDTVFGETVYHWPGPENGTAGEEADFFAEVYVGRAPVDTPQKTANFVSKTIAYEQATQQDYLKKALAVGTSLDDITEGGNGEDAVTDIIPQYTTMRLYTRDGTYSRTAVIDQMNSGTHIVTDDGHANYRNVMGLSISDVDALTNTQYFFVYSLGCYSAAFDQATSGSQQAIAEHFVFNPHGAFAYVGNSRYGWYCPASSDGPGERYDRAFFSVLKAGTTNLGKALQLSKEQEPIPDRWTCFTLNLLGDPETPLVTAITAPTAHFKTTADLLSPPRLGGLAYLQGTARRGTAAGATFSNYTVEFGLGTSPTSWMRTGINLTGGGGSEVVNGTLATWNTSLVAPNTYTLKLTALSTQGLVGEDRKIVVVSQNAVVVYIRNDGVVDPAGAPIQRKGNLYTLTSSIFSDGDGIVVQRSNIILRGQGYMVGGSAGEGAGIRLEGLNNVTIENITVTAHLYGVYAENCSNVTISQSNLVGNVHGVFLLASTSSDVSGCNVTNNYDGISLLSGSNSNSIAYNTIAENEGMLGSGVYVYLSSNNRLHHNTFINNTVHVYDGAWDCSDPDLYLPSINIWDDGYPSGGNYWSNYTGSDHFSGPYQNLTGNDGIGDTPYTIDRYNTDHYPLMSPSQSVHDVAVSALTPSRTVIALGSSINITVTVTNQGTFDEDFNVSVTVNSTVIANKMVTLPFRGSQDIIVTWNTSGLVKGSYTVLASAQQVSGEVDVSDNNRSSSLKVTVPGDVDGNFRVNMGDINDLCNAFGSTLGLDGNYWHHPSCLICPHSSNCDIDGNSRIDMGDINSTLNNFGKHFP